MVALAHQEPEGGFPVACGLHQPAQLYLKCWGHHGDRMFSSALEAPVRAGPDPEAGRDGEEGGAVGLCPPPPGL